MKFTLIPILFASTASADPILTSWFTEPSGRYARIYRDTEDQEVETSVTTWARGAGIQAQPTYAGVHEIAATPTDVFLRSSGLGFQSNLRRCV